MAQSLDSTDRRLVALLQADASLTAQELAERVALSPSQCARRRQRLEQSGVIRGYRAEVDQARMGRGVEAFVQIVMASHSRTGAADFVRLMQRTEEVEGLWTLTGDADYLLRVFAEDLAALNRLVQEALLPHDAVSRVHSRIVMERLKTGFAACG